MSSSTTSKIISPQPTRAVQPGVGNSRSNVLAEPIDHMIQPFKQTNVRLYEVLKRLQSQLISSTNTITGQNTTIDNNTTNITEALGSKATFGIVRSPTVQQMLTNTYICRKPGNFIDVIATSINPPHNTLGDTSSRTTFQISKSTDVGVHWGPVIAFDFIPGVALIQEVKVTVNGSIALADLLKIDCIAVASGSAGSGYEIVLRWQ